MNAHDEKKLANIHNFERALDWMFATLNLFAVVMLGWIVIPRINEFAEQNKIYNDLRQREFRMLTEQITKEVNHENLEHEERANEQRQKVYDKLSEILISINQDRKREHDEFQKEITEIKKLLQNNKAHKIQEKP